MIRVVKANEPEPFGEHVRERGRLAIERLLGRAVDAPGRKPSKTYARPEDIPAGKFPQYWTEKRESDNKSALDDMRVAYGGRCAYTSLRLSAIAWATVDHYVPKARDWRLVYEWSNYRLCLACVNTAKGEKAVIDPFEVGPGWFVLNLDSLHVCRGPCAPASEIERIEETISILNIWQCVEIRHDYLWDYYRGMIELEYLDRQAPFIAYEIRRQGRLAARDNCVEDGQ